MRPTQMAVTLLSVLALVTAPAAGQPPVGPGGPDDGETLRRHQRGHDFVVEYLELDEEQQAEWEALAESQRSLARDSMAQMRDLRADIEAQIESGSPDATSIGRAVIETHALRESLRALHEDFDERFSAVLRSDQLERWEALQALRETRGDRGRRHHRAAKGLGGGPHGRRSRSDADPVR